MRNITGQAVMGDDLYGRGYELSRLWEHLTQGEHVLMLAPRRVGKTSLMLELHRAPHENWDVVYVDVQRGEGAADCIAAILAALAAIPDFRSRFEAFPFSSAVKDIFGRLSATVDTGVLRVELKSAIGSEWSNAAEHLQARLMRLPDADRKLLIIVDELPILVSRMLHTDGRKDEAELLLSWFRQVRQTPDLRDRVHTLVGGSIGLEGVLRRVGLSGLINDLTPFRVDSWNRSTATAFLHALGENRGFRLNNLSIVRILELLRDPVPYHIQLFFSALRDDCKGDATCMSREVIDQCFNDRLAGPSGIAHLDHYATRLEIALDAHEHDVAINILGSACRRNSGASLAEFEESIRRDEPTFWSVLRDLEADGYLTRDEDRLEFRSNLLREWWRKRYGRGATP